MTAIIGIRDIARNIDNLAKYDYVEIEDKKTHEQKGLFVSVKYAKELKEILDKKIQEDSKKEIEELTRFIGVYDGDTENRSSQEIKTLKGNKYAE